ncbi:MAG TPA: hypothetical protein VFA92_16490 [Candidatus Binatia bacterium]|nr:hypothetical protein [Candidatus Binatia bacterium]
MRERLKRIRNPVLLGVGVIAPLGVLAVNGAAFLMQHLSQFSLTIAGLTALSCLLLNGLAARQAMDIARRNATPLFTEYRRWIITLAVIAVLISAAVATWLTYQGMQNPNQLPDVKSVLGALVALGMPFLLTYAERGVLRRFRRLGRFGRGRPMDPPPQPRTNSTPQV